MTTKVVFPWGVLTKDVNRVLAAPSVRFVAIPKGNFVGKPGFRTVEFTVLLDVSESDIASCVDELCDLLNGKVAAAFVVAQYRVEES